VTTKLEKPLKREISVQDKPFIVTLTPLGLKITAKGRRNGLELAWEAMVTGDAALATALNASLQDPP
jgi:hypothetical protein